MGERVQRRSREDRDRPRARRQRRRRRHRPRAERPLPPRTDQRADSGRQGLGGVAIEGRSERPAASACAAGAPSREVDSALGRRVFEPRRHEREELVASPELFEEGARSSATSSAAGSAWRAGASAPRPGPSRECRRRSSRLPPRDPDRSAIAPAKCGALVRVAQGKCDRGAGLLFREPLGLLDGVLSSAASGRSRRARSAPDVAVEPAEVWIVRGEGATPPQDAAALRGRRAFALAEIPPPPRGTRPPWPASDPPPTPLGRASRTSRATKPARAAARRRGGAPPRPRAPRAIALRVRVPPSTPAPRLDAPDPRDGRR